MKLYVDGQRRPPPGWTAATTIEAAQAHLQSGNVETISLGYDMGACDDCLALDCEAARTSRCKHKRNGYDLVRWMVDTGYWPQSKPIVHTGNPNGASKIRSLLEYHWADRVTTRPAARATRDRIETRRLLS